MKRCPQCGNTYTDNRLNFCLQDGATLDLVEGNLPPTKVMDSGQQSTITVSGPPPTPPRLQSDVHPQQRDSRRTIFLALALAAVFLLAGVLALWIWLGESGTGTQGQVEPNTNRKPGEMSEVSNENINTGSSSAASPTAEPNLSAPSLGTISGRMSYPSDGIPATMVACAENIETGAARCTKPRAGWTSRVSYSLQLPPGRYHVYARISAQDGGAGDLARERAYYTEYMKCGMAAHCNSHRRIVLEVKPGETLAGITVGDWWANLK